MDMGVKFCFPSHLHPRGRIMFVPEYLYLILFEILLLFNGIVGQEFFKKYRGAIQNYIMTGQEEGWGQNCDILSGSTHSHGGMPQINMALDKLHMMNPKSVFSSSKCLLADYDVTSKADLSALLEFGRAAINHVRLALVVKLHSGVTLDMAKNTSKLAYLVAAESSQGKEQFLCPVVGDFEPRLEEEMCKLSYVSYTNKKVRIGLVGVPPEFVFTSDGGIEGTTIRLIKMLADRLRFMPEYIITHSYNAAERMVRKLKL